MTAANEKPLPCPFCGNNDSINESDCGRWHQVICMACGATGPEVMKGCLPDAIATWNRRAQPADLPIAVGVDVSRGDDMTARAYLYEGGIMHVKYEPPSQPATGSITATCETTSNLPYTVGQTAEAVDDAEYTQGLAYDGVVILKDGEPVTIDEVLAMLNARARGGK